MGLGFNRRVWAGLLIVALSIPRVTKMLNTIEAGKDDTCFETTKFRPAEAVQHCQCFLRIIRLDKKPITFWPSHDPPLHPGKTCIPKSNTLP